MAPIEKEPPPRVRVREGNPCCDCRWLVTTCEGILKMLELFATFLSFVIICAGLNVSKYKLEAKYEFLVVVGIAAWVFVAVHIILKVTHVFEKLPNVLQHPMLGVVLCAISTVVFIVASAVVYGYSFNWPTLHAGAGCGFVTAGLFLFETIMLFIRYKRGVRPPQRQGTSQPAKPLRPPSPQDEAKKEEKKNDNTKTAEELGFPP